MKNYLPAASLKKFTNSIYSCLFTFFFSILQEFECCGISSEGFRDWSKNAYFNCTTNKEDNPSVERCGVPFSCCINDEGNELINYMCGFGIQELNKKSEIETKVSARFLELTSELLHSVIVLYFIAISLQIFTQGCIPKLQGYFEQNLYTVGGIALGVALAQLLGES